MIAQKPLSPVLQLKSFWASLPITNKILTITTITFFIYQFYDPPTHLVNTPEKMLSGEFHRLFSSSFVNLNLIQLFFALVSLLPDTIRMEKNQGSLSLLLSFFLKNIIIQFAYLGFMLLLTYFLKEMLVLLYVPTFLIEFNLLSIPSFGLWNIAMVILTQRCAQNPDQRVKIYFFEINLKQKYYPIIIYIVSAVIFKFIFDFFVAMLLGYLEFYLLKKDFYVRFLQNLEKPLILLEENRLFHKFFTNRSDYTTIINSEDYMLRIDRNNVSLKEINPAAANLGAASVITFYDGQGYILGGNLDTEGKYVFADYSQEETELMMGNRAEEERVGMIDSSTDEEFAIIKVDKRDQGSEDEEEEEESNILM